MFLFPHVPLCVLLRPQAAAEPDECWWPGARGGSDGCSAHRGTGGMFCAPSPQPEHTQPLLSTPPVVPCLHRPR